MKKRLVGEVMMDGAVGYPKEHALLEREMNRFLSAPARFKRLRHIAKLLDKELGAKKPLMKLVKRAVRNATQYRRTAQSAKTKSGNKKKN